MRQEDPLPKGEIYYKGALYPIAIAKKMAAADKVARQSRRDLASEKRKRREARHGRRRKRMSCKVR